MNIICSYCGNTQQVDVEVPEGTKHIESSYCPACYESNFNTKFEQFFVTELVKILDTEADKLNDVNHLRRMLFEHINNAHKMMGANYQLVDLLCKMRILADRQPRSLAHFIKNNVPKEWLDARK